MASVRKPLSWLVVFVTAFVVLQLLSIIALHLLERIRHVTYAPMTFTSVTQPQRIFLEDFLAGRWGPVAYSPVLGWTATPNRRTLLSRVPRRGVLRIAAFGDFIFSGGSEDKESWQDAIMRAHRNVDVLNFVVQDFGIDQAFLRYEEDGAAYKPDLVVIGFFSDNIALTMNVFRPFFNPNTDLPLAKPRYVLQNGKLVLLPNPMRTLPQYSDLLTSPARVLPMLGRHDAYYQSAYHRGTLAVLPSVRLYQILRDRVHRRTAIGTISNSVYNVDSEAFRVTAAIFDEFVTAVRRAGAVPVIVALPRAEEIDRYRRDGTKMYAPLLERFHAKGYRYLDMLEGFEEYGSTFTAAGLAPNQYSMMGNSLVAKRLWQFLVTQRLTDPHNLRSR